VNIHALVLVALCRSAGPARFNFSSACGIQRAKLSGVGHSLNEMSVTRGAVGEAPQQSVRLTSINSSAGSINRFSSRCKVTPKRSCSSRVSYKESRHVYFYCRRWLSGSRSLRCAEALARPVLFFIFLQNTTRQVVGHRLCAAIAAPPST
jgi:hypothetical protein